MQPKKLFSLFFLLFFFIGPLAYDTYDALAVTEDELLAEFAKNPANLIPDMVAIFSADVEVTYNYKTAYQTKSIRSVTTILDIPVILSTEDSGKLALNPADEKSAEQENWGISQLTGDKNYLVENRTDLAYTKLDITNDYSVESYYYVLFEKLQTKDLTSTSSIKVSFGKTATSNISSSAETYNVTLTSNTVYAIRNTLWYNLACYTNETFPYVINIEAQNIDVKGFYIFQFDNSRFVVDSRYDVTYLDVDETPVSLSVQTEDIGGQIMLKYVAPQESDLSLKATSLDELNTTKMLSVSSPLDAVDDMYVVVRGWKTANDLEDDLEEAWKQQLDLPEGAKITGYSLNKGYFQYVLNQGLVKLIKKELKEQLDSTTDYNTLVNNVMKKILPVVAVANEDDAFDAISFALSTEYAGFWDTVKSSVKSATSAVTSIATKVIDAPAKIIDSLGNTAAKVVTPVAQTVESVTPHVTNMIKDNVGHITNGVVGVAGAAKDLGKGIMDSLKVPLMIVAGVAGVGIVLFLIIRFGPMLKK